MKEFIKPYLQCNFRPINFYFDDEFDTAPMIPFRYWLSYEDLIFMRILYSHLKELSFLTEFASKDDISPSLYKLISDFGYFIEKKLMSVLKDLGLINDDTFEQFDKNNLIIYQESSSTAIVEILDLLRVESILKGGSVDYLAALMYQLLIFQSTDNLKIDFDGHFSPKYYNTRNAMTGKGSLSIKTLDLRMSRTLRCPPFFDNQVFKRYADKISEIKNTPSSRIIKNDSLGAITTQSHQRHHTEITTIQSGKDRLLEDCVKAVIEYQSFVERESKKLQPLINNNLFGEEDLDNVGIEDLTKLQQQNTLNLIIPSRYIESKKTGIMSYLLKFAQSIAISTASNERTFADLRNSEEEFKSSDELLEAYLHLFMWEREDSELCFFKKMRNGLEVRRQRDLDYEFIKPYLQCNFRPINFYFNDEFDTAPMIPFRYWLSYEDLIFMRILYSHLKELSFLTEFALKDDVSPFLYKSISDFGYFIEKKLMSVLKDLGLINGDTFEQFDKNNLIIYQESSSTAIVEILDLLRVESILKGGSVEYLAALMYQLLIFQSTDNLKIDFDGHFSPKYYNTRNAMTGKGSLSVKTLDLRMNRTLRCPPFFDNQVFKRYADKISEIKNTPSSRIIRNDSLGAITTQSHQIHHTEITTIQSGKDRLLEDCVKAVIEYQSFVERESKKLQPLINNNSFGEEDLDNVGIEDLTKYIESKKTGIMSYLLKFAQSIAISTASNERTFADLRNSEEEFKSSDELLEAYLHLFMWEREDKGKET
ncbi:hypothetical protein HANVADRAFT_2550 [Hanseniaspora valbyensis NRRL Y-1626]|uniref:Uncharacterized protein n=1 Tax=Hanseniaspora valbyensis NRRL Y-1626 TaxID=766949 RepID=A0A1B7TDC8_9ASCO|nr:hypothetical protein HANVADRAFT_2550 [Hanseniaspora valbyensis NRRL Y-1626]